MNLGRYDLFLSLPLSPWASWPCLLCDLTRHVPVGIVGAKSKQSLDDNKCHGRGLIPQMEIEQVRGADKKFLHPGWDEAMQTAGASQYSSGPGARLPAPAVAALKHLMLQSGMSPSMAEELSFNATIKFVQGASQKEERKITAEHEKERRKKPKKVEAGNMAMTREEADRNAEELLEELAREEKLLSVKKERRKELKKLKKMAGIEERESGIEEWEAGIEDREAGIEERAGMGAREAGMFLINQRLGLDRAAAGKAGGGQKSQAWEEQVLVPSSQNDASECCVCLANNKSWIFIPCGHVCVCRGCAEDIMQSSRQCPLCCQKAIGIFQVFL
jgi:hypothetical protein